jgi:DNA-binding beta-propeller fold protein YncE
LCLFAAAIAMLPTGAGALQQKGGQDETGAYDVVEQWFKPVREGWTHHVLAVYAETANRIFVAAAGVTPLAPSRPGDRVAAPPLAFDTNRPGASRDYLLVIVDSSGKMIVDLTHDLGVRGPHAVQISPYDPVRHVWIVDREGQQVLKATNDGKRIVLALGEKGVPGIDAGHFNRPTDIAFLPDGSFLIADGYVNARIVKFDKSGKFVAAWGTKGSGPRQFNLVHCVAVDGQGRIYVADRSNGRIQVLDANGGYIEEWQSRRPTHLMITRDQFAWVSDGDTSRILKYDLTGTLLTYWGIPGSSSSSIDPHTFSVDPDGNLYVADYDNHRVQKFTPKAQADRSRLVGQPLQ